MFCDTWVWTPPLEAGQELFEIPEGAEPSYVDCAPILNRALTAASASLDYRSRCLLGDAPEQQKDTSTGTMPPAQEEMRIQLHDAEKEHKCVSIRTVPQAQEHENIQLHSVENVPKCVSIRTVPQVQEQENIQLHSADSKHKCVRGMPVACRVNKQIMGQPLGSHPLPKRRATKGQGQRQFHDLRRPGGGDLSPRSKARAQKWADAILE